MTYEQALDYIHSRTRFGIKPGLSRISALLRELGDPQRDLSCVHIAGTNGKGSTSTALSNIMIAAGKKTGLFISPYVVDFRERIQINGVYIAKEDFARLTERVAAAVPRAERQTDDRITEFELITAVMFLYFAEQKCDIAVLETGLGGRLDSTNVLEHPLACVITRIALDHMAVLGGTVPEIAAEKCGIIKQGCPVITASSQHADALSVIRETAARRSAVLYIAQLPSAEGGTVTPYGSSFVYRNLPITVSLPGRHQIENMTVAAETALTLGVGTEAITEGIAATKFPARLEVLSKEPLVLLDGAHNENGAAALSAYLDEFHLKPVVLMGMMRDKNCDAVMQKIASRAAAVYTVTVQGNPRTESAEELARIAARYCGCCAPEESYDKAFQTSFAEAKRLGTPLVICGSLYLASDIRQSAIDLLKK